MNTKNKADPEPENERENKYTDDLKFLNRFNKVNILKFQSSFKNEGRALIRQRKKLDEKSKREAGVGHYNVSYRQILGNSVNSQQNLVNMSIDEGADLEAKDRRD